MLAGRAFPGFQGRGPRGSPGQDWGRGRQKASRHCVTPQGRRIRNSRGMRVGYREGRLGDALVSSVLWGPCRPCSPRGALPEGLLRFFTRPREDAFPESRLGDRAGPLRAFSGAQASGVGCRPLPRAAVPV